ncbi:hypothetical protein F4818DRAFT_211914 [Hypoxylon cercidicola]|nr:hypothetical protein F4818DRAFT_211914 [Hypoxylon cercidicola]
MAFQPISKQAFPNIIRWAVHEDRGDSGYNKLCRARMLVSHWSMEKFGAPPNDCNIFRWRPAFILQTNVLLSGGLILCFAFPNYVTDE